MVIKKSLLRAEKLNPDFEPNENYDNINLTFPKTIDIYSDCVFLSRLPDIKKVRSPGNEVG